MNSSPPENQPSNPHNQPLSNEPISSGSGLAPHMSSGKTKIWLGIVILLFAGMVLLAGGYLWYQKNTSPVDASAETRVFAIEEGESANAIAERLEQENFIRNALAFKIALRLEGAARTIQPGPYEISASQSVNEIISQLQEGIIEVADFTIIPGESLFELEAKLSKLGYSQSLIDEAFTREYDHPALQKKPADASLEGYLYPDTYQLNLSHAPSEVIEKALDNFHAKVDEQNLYDKFSNSDLSFHEAVIMASIVEREVNTDEDRPIVAQVFLSRLEIDMQLGADSTFVYAAKKDGEKPAIDYPSPYNTRVNRGLPPGPISSFTVDALESVANPADTDYLYFVTDDNNVTHYAKTEEGHQENVDNHCGERCKL